MNKRGFTLVELVTVIAIILALGLIVTPKVMSIINNNRNKSYKEIEKRLEEAAGKYVIENYVDSSLPFVRIDKEELINGKYIDEVYDLKDKSVCDAYVNVSNLSYVASFKAVLDCSNYDTILTKVGLNVFLNGGTTTQTFETSYDIGTVITLQNPTKNGSNFIGWEVVGGDATLNENVLTLNNVDTTIYAKWQNGKVNINYNLNGGIAGESAPTEGTNGQTITVSNPSKTGYTFTNWTVSGTGASINDTSLTIGTSDITLTANWTINTYIITYELDGGTFENEMPTQAEYGSTIILENPIKEGYTFIGLTASGNNAILSGNSLTIGDGDVTLTANWVKTITEFAYTGGEQTFVVPVSGYYKLETWGGQGGIYNPTNHSRAGYGGYSAGTILLIVQEKLYVNVGGIGVGGADYVNGYGIVIAGAYNGGGKARTWVDNKTVGSGGGATHIAYVSGELSFLPSLFENMALLLDNLLIVSGGGGGTASESVQYYSGDGGGYIGNSGYAGGNSWFGRGASQTAGGSNSPGEITGNAAGFGQGGYAYSQSGSTYGNSSGGGGGFYGGGAGVGAGGFGGGGSGYIGNSLLTDKYMYCYNCATSDAVDTKTFTTTCAEETPTENCAKKGNGYAKITYVGKSIN